MENWMQNRRASFGWGTFSAAFHLTQRHVDIAGKGSSTSCSRYCAWKFIFLCSADFLPRCTKATIFGMLRCSYRGSARVCCLIASSAGSLMLHLVLRPGVMVFTPKRYRYQSASIGSCHLRQRTISSWDMGLFKLPRQTTPLVVSLWEAAVDG